MTTAILIPARLHSTRLPAKLLLRETGQSVLRHTYEACLAADCVRYLAVATADAEIAAEVRRWQGNVLWTRPDHANGTSRIAEAATALPPVIDLVLNVQGDEPAVDPLALDALDAAMRAPGRWDVGTLVAPLAAERADQRSTVKAAVSGQRALYFSRAPLAGAMHHVGVYAYRRDRLAILRHWPFHSELMAAECLEQLGFLEIGWQMLACRIPAPFLSVDTRDDYEQFVRWHRNRTAARERCN